MSRKNILPFKVATAQSLSATFTTVPTTISYLDNCSYQINVTTTNSIGSFVVEGSLDYKLGEPGNVVTTPGNWSVLTLSGSPAVSAANDVILINLNQLPFNAIRLTYTASTAGTGVCDIFLLCKQVGG